jgi:hypothetical protein
MRSSKPIPNGTNPSSEASDDDKTKILFLEPDGVSGGPVFIRQIFGVRSC